MMKYKKLWRKFYFEIKYYPERVVKYKTLWLWGKRMRSIRQADKHKRYRQKGYARLRKSYAKLERLGVKNCKVCGTTEHLTVDHVIPVSKGGTNSLENLQVLCNDCNQLKADKLSTG